MYPVLIGIYLAGSQLLFTGWMNGWIDITTLRGLNTGISCFIVLFRYCIFLQIEHLWQPCVKQVKSISAIFPKTFAHFLYFVTLW